jgi:hypothetical protein
VAYSRVQDIVVQRCAENAKRRDRQFRDTEQDEARAFRNTIGDVSAYQAADAQAGHERRNDDCGRIHVGSRKDR